MASTANRDPRLNNKRPASRSPDGNVSSSSANKKHTGPLRQFSANRAGDSPLGAVMSPARASETPASMIVVEDFFKATTTAAGLSIELKAAQTEYAKADREYRNMQDKFEQFPAIKDQKTQARNRAQTKLENIERQLNEQKPRQSQILVALAGLFDQNSPDQSNTSSISFEDVKSIKVQTGQVPSLQSSLGRLEPRVLALEDRLNKLTTPDDAIESRLQALENAATKGPVTSPPTLKRLTELETAVKKMPVDVSGRVKKLEFAVMEAPTCSVTDALDKRVDRLESSISTSTTAPPSADMVSRIQALENHKRKGTPVLEGATGERLNAIETRLGQVAEDSKADKDELIQHRDELDKSLELIKTDLATLRSEVSHLMVTTETRLTSELAALRTIMDEATKKLNHNADALNDYMERLKKLEDSPLSESLNRLQQMHSEMQKRLQAVESTRAITRAPSAVRASMATPGTSTWQPVLPDNDDEGGSTPQINGVGSVNGNPDVSARMFGEIDMLKGVTAQHTRIINNLTTDDLVRQMVDQMSQMYPDARGFQQAIGTLRSELNAVKERLSVVSNTVNTTAASLSQLSQRIPNFDGDIGQEVGKLQKSCADLQQRFENHDTVLDEGKDRLLKVNILEGEVKELTAAALNLPEYAKKVADLHVRVTTVEDAVKNVRTTNDVSRRLANGSH